VSIPEPLAPTPSAIIASSSSSRPVDTQKVLPRSRDGLAEEVALLSRAETELRAGRPAKALSALSEHQRKFPRGALAEERAAARIQALCALGRTDDANAQLRQLLHLSPNSAHEGRARQACRDSHSAPP
jgi:Flp pilus assembly protein TadD